MTVLCLAQLTIGATQANAAERNQFAGEVSVYEAFVESHRNPLGFDRYVAERGLLQDSSFMGCLKKAAGLVGADASETSKRCQKLRQVNCMNPSGELLLWIMDVQSLARGKKWIHTHTGHSQIQMKKAADMAGMTVGQLIEMSPQSGNLVKAYSELAKSVLSCGQRSGATGQRNENARLAPRGKPDRNKMLQEATTLVGRLEAGKQIDEARLRYLLRKLGLEEEAKLPLHAGTASGIGFALLGLE